HRSTRGVGGNFRLRNHLVAVFVVSRERFVERDCLHLLARLILRKAPAVYVEILVVVPRNRLHLTRETAHPPHALAILNRVSRKLERLRDDDLLRTLRWLINDRRRITGDHDR